MVIAALAAQIAGGFAAPYVKKLFARKTTALLAGTATTAGILALVVLMNNFWIALALIFLWGLVFAAMGPIRQTYLNKLIPSEQRATVLSFDSLLGSSGGIVVQPTLGKVADLSGYPASYLAAAVVQLGALPFLFLARRKEVKVGV